MKATALLGPVCLLLGMVFLNFSSCTVFDDAPTPALTRYNLPSQVLENVFTADIPKDMRNVDGFLDGVVRNGMTIHQGDDPPEIYSLSGSSRAGIRFVVDSDCIYDGKTPSNVGSVYGKYEETIQVYREQNSFLAEVSYSSLAGGNYSEYPDGLDTGSGTGYVSGNGNNFTIFYRAEDGRFDGIHYEAIWIISGTVSNSPNTREITHVTKCLVMLDKDTDREDKVANRGTVRIFRDAGLDWIQPEVRISDVTPTEGPHTTEVTINGTGFGSVEDSVEVRFNGIIAEVLEASPNQLRVTVPKGAGSGPVSVQVNEVTGTGTDFIYIPIYTVTTLAGTGNPGYIDGTGSLAQFSNPYGLAVDAQETVYVADTGNELIRMITPAGEVSTWGIPENYYLPNGVAIDARGNVYVSMENVLAKYSADGEYLSVYEISSPGGITVDDLENVYISLIKENMIWVISPEGDYTFLGPDYPFNRPSGIAVDSLGQVYVADSGNHQILKITPEGEVTALAGGEAGFRDGAGSVARFNNPSGVAADSEGNVYVADMGNHRIRKISQSGEVSTLAGGGAGYRDDIGSSAAFNSPSGIAVDKQGVIYVADYQNHRIRKMVLE